MTEKNESAYSFEDMQDGCLMGFSPLAVETLAVAVDKSISDLCNVLVASVVRFNADDEYITQRVDAYKELSRFRDFLLDYLRSE